MGSNYLVGLHNSRPPCIA